MHYHSVHHLPWQPVLDVQTVDADEIHPRTQQ